MANTYGVAIDILIGMFPQLAQIYKQQLEREIITQSGVSDGGKIAGWAKQIAASMQLSNVKYMNGSITGTISLPPGNNEARAQVLMHGNFGIGDPPMTKPGMRTWDSNMQEQSVHVLSDQAPRRMPQKFLRDPMISWQIMQNTGKKADKRIYDYVRGQSSQLLLENINSIVKQLAKGGK